MNRCVTRSFFTFLFIFVVYFLAGWSVFVTAYVAHLWPVLRIRDIYPDPNFFHPVSLIRIKEIKYFSPKKTVSKLSENMIRVVHPVSGFWFFTHPGSWIQGSKKQRIRIRNTVHDIWGMSGFEPKELAVISRHATNLATYPLFSPGRNFFLSIFLFVLRTSSLGENDSRFNDTSVLFPNIVRLFTDCSHLSVLPIDLWGCKN